MKVVGLRWIFMAVLMPCLIGLVLFFATIYQSESGQLERTTQQLARTVSAQVDAELLGAQHALQGLAATSHELDRMDIQTFRQHALQFMAASGYGDAIALVDASGQQLMNTKLPYGSPLPKTSNLADTALMFAQGKPYVSNLFAGAVSKQPLLAIAAPVIRAGKERYKLIMGVSAGTLAQLAKAQSLPPGWGLVIYDRQGTIAVRIHSPQKFVGQKVIPVLLEKLNGPIEGLMKGQNLDKVAVVGAYHRSPQTGYSVAIGAPESVLLVTLYKRLFFPALVLLSISLASGLLMRRFTGQMRASLRSLSQAIDAASQRQSDHDVPANGPAEFVQLAAQFNRLQDMQREAELTLHEVERFAGIGRWEWDITADTHVWSAEIYRLYGRDPALPPAVYPEVQAYFTAESWAQLTKEVVQCLTTGEPYQCDAQLVHSDGTQRWVFITGSAQRDPQGKVFKLQGLVQDITSRKQTELALERVNRALKLVSECNSELVHSADEATLLSSICNQIVETGGYLMAWIGFAHSDEAKSILPVAKSDSEQGYLDSIHISWGDNAEGQGPTGMAYRLQTTQVNQNCLTNPLMSPWSEAALNRGYQASISLPLLAGENMQGVLTIYAREPDAFQHDEVALLEQLANDLAYGIAALRNEEARKQAVALQQVSEERYRTVLDNAADAVVIATREGRFIYANHQSLSLLGYPLDELLGMTLAEITPAAEASKVLGMLDELTSSRQARGEMDLKSHGGKTIPVEVHAVALPDGNVYAACRDITERKQFEADLEYAATHDKLTGLANRHLLHDRIAQAIALARREHQSVALMLLDLDRFKTINDTLTHNTGDLLLQEVAQRLQQQVREGDTVARLGGDEFMVVMSDVASAGEVAELARTLMQHIQQPLLAAGHHIVVTASAGISLYPRDGDSVHELIRNADVAMYRAKELGRDEFQFYAPEMNERMLERLQLESSLRRALQMNELELYYQPKVSLADGRIVGAEALIRWQRPGHGMVSPGQFIPLAEETGLILPMGAWAIRAACAQLKHWQAQGLPEVPVAINLSARQFQQSGLAELVQQEISRHGLHPGVIELEITESALMIDPEKAKRILLELRDMGVRIALDDFGTGYSSLNYLKRLPVDTLKIDQSFVHGLSSELHDVAIAKMVIELGHALGMNVVAEGVETVEQQQQLRTLGCDEMQGYLFSKPLPAEQFGRLLATSTKVHDEQVVAG
ncbi:EAL domain-containing protein [Crenobacter sp. SG2303]|uniref:EAL domain-containing protein n=1 Tax=Crenobacter oryzisoli TaxID=3056844 RepID=A0ABT7XQZ8_9NEIS|nr:EAL domain-containing protein [Crenobacter sp. SG2303]MDN0076200.1 EAL domain-containing protein [Crenobacter sp. SG2303]